MGIFLKAKTTDLDTFSFVTFNQLVERIQNFVIAPNTARLHSAPTRRSVPQRSGDVLCLTCKNPLNTGSKFCSDACYAKSLTKSYPWEQMAIALYENTDWGFKRIAKKINAPAHAVYGVLRRLGLIDFARKKKAEDSRRKKFGLGKGIKELTVVYGERLMFEEFKRERHKLKKYDESNHWRSHPVANSESFRKKYRSDLNFQSYVKSQASKQWQLKKEDSEYRKIRTAQHRIWKSKNKDHVKSSQRQWLNKNPEKRKSYRKARHVKEKLNPVFRIRRTLRKRLSKILKGKSNTVGKSAILGCTSSQLREHLQNKFRNGMTWQNYGTYWQVDHILPCAAFDHTDIKEVKICWNWQNLRPLEADKNLEKSDTITEPQQFLPLCL